MEEFLKEIKNRPSRLCKQCGKCNGIVPQSFWDKIPQDCGFEGWFFQKREEEKQKIRKEKEVLLSFEVLLESSPQENIKQIEEINENINKIKKTISMYEKYGANDW